MTIDEAISHAREVAECQKMSARLIEDNAYIPESVDKEAITYGNTICANEHEQLAEWLEELKQYRAIGTVEECRAAMEKQIVEKELESHDEKYILKYCISLMQSWSESSRNGTNMCMVKMLLGSWTKRNAFIIECHILVSFKNCFFSEPVILEVHLREQNVNS